MSQKIKRLELPSHYFRVNINRTLYNLQRLRRNELLFLANVVKRKKVFDTALNKAQCERIILNAPIEQKFLIKRFFNLLNLTNAKYSKLMRKEKMKIWNYAFMFILGKFHIHFPQYIFNFDFDKIEESVYTILHKYHLKVDSESSDEESTESDDPRSKKKEKPNTDSDSSSSESVSEDASKKNSQTLKSTSVKKKSQSGNYTAYEQLDITKGNQYRTRVIYKILKTSHFLSFPSINKIQIICNVSYNWDFWKCITQEDIKNLYIGDALRRYKKRKKLTFKLFKREYGRMSTDEKDTILEEFAKYQILKTKFNFLEDYFTEQLNNRKAQLSQPRKRKKENQKQQEKEQENSKDQKAEEKVKKEQ